MEPLLILTLVAVVVGGLGIVGVPLLLVYHWGWNRGFNDGCQEEDKRFQVRANETIEEAVRVRDELITALRVGRENRG